ncbi:hypothetical protein [Chitinophaga sp.]|uniref:hypothetical protein n=1 Tax=Chitinophaga sp. TaxID=1869181 RepID=UPI0031D0CD21
MKHFYILCLFFITSLLCRPSPGMAQSGGSDAEIKDKIRAAEIAYLAQKLDLTPDEAQKFWPVYNQYTKEVELLIAERNNRNNASNAAEKANSKTNGDQELKYDQRMLDIKNHYDKEFQKVLPANKAGSVFRSEREFRVQLIRQLKERQMRNVGGPGARRFRN